MAIPFKSVLSCLVFSLASGAVALAADVSVQLSDVHLCCGSCVKGANAAIATVAGAQGTANKDDGTIAITAPDTATAQKAVDALLASGFFGVSNNADVKVNVAPSPADAMVKSARVTHVHLCCPKCVTSVNDALAKVPGVTGNTATKGSDSFEVTGEFSVKTLIDTLRAEGWAGKIAE